MGLGVHGFMLPWLLQCRNCWMFLQTVTVTNLLSIYWPPVWDTRGVNGVQLYEAETDRGCHAHAWRAVTLSHTAVGWGLRGPCKGWNPCGVRELQPPEQNLYLIHRLGFWVRLHAGEGKKKKVSVKNERSLLCVRNQTKQSFSKCSLNHWGHTSQLEVPAATAHHSTWLGWFFKHYRMDLLMQFLVCCWNKWTPLLEKYMH